MLLMTIQETIVHDVQQSFDNQEIGVESLHSNHEANETPISDVDELYKRGAQIIVLHKTKPKLCELALIEPAAPHWADESEQDPSEIMDVGICAENIRKMSYPAVAVYTVRKEELQLGKP